MYRIVPALIPFILVLAVASDSAPAADSPARPNLVYILCDDLGYGDVNCLNPEGKIPTPNMDRIAAAGMTFTDAHSGSSVCSPTRYGVLTGRYSWRSRLKQGVLGGLSPRLIEPDRMTVAAFLRQHGYHTAAVGKWHLGMDWVKLTGRDVAELNIESAEQVRNVDFSKPIANGPNSVGFDYYFGISASLDMVPYTFIENDRVTALPTEDADFEMMPGKPGRTRRGPRAPEFDAIDVLPRLTEKAVEYIGQRAADAKAGRPFFLYLPLNAPHTPTLPTPQWQGKSGLNAYGDFVMQTDATVGRVLDALDQHGLTDSTLVIFTSDNGGVFRPENTTSLQTKAFQAGLRVNGSLRGGKHSVWEGGFKVPFLVRWPGRVPAGTTCRDMVSLADLLATIAAVVGENLPAPDKAGEDSHNILPAILGQAGTAPARSDLIVHSADGVFALRQGPWKWIEGVPVDDIKPGVRKVRAAEFRAQLYNLQDDPAETRDVSAEHPEVAQKLAALLDRYRDGGYSRELPPVTSRPKVQAVELPPLDGAVVIQEPLNAMPEKPWAALRGTWTVRDEAVWGAQDRGDQQPATLRRGLPITDGTLQYEINFGDAGRHSLRIHTAGNRHSFRIVISPSQIEIAKNPSAGEGQDQVIPLARERLQLKRGQWHTLRLSFKGTEAVAQIAGVTARAAHPILGEPKELMNLLVFEGDAGFRKLIVVR